jgi:hypothetical protein
MILKVTMGAQMTPPVPCRCVVWLAQRHETQGPQKGNDSCATLTPLCADIAVHTSDNPLSWDVREDC